MRYKRGAPPRHISEVCLVPRDYSYGRRFYHTYNILYRGVLHCYNQERVCGAQAIIIRTVVCYADVDR